MIGKQVIRTEFVKPFSLRERFHVLFGKRLKVIIFTEVTAKGNLKRKEITISHENKGMQAYYGIPVPKPVALPTAT